MSSARDWTPFKLAAPGEHADAPRALTTKDGIGDRLRAAAFAEVQARDGFLWAADHFEDASEDLRRAWRNLAKAEQRHLDWLLNRMSELGFEISERRVSDRLWASFMDCKSACEFARFMANAEERGRRAGERFHDALKEIDPISAQIFGKIAEEEIAHIALAEQFFPREAAANAAQAQA